MKKIACFRTISIVLVLFNIINFFFMAAAWTGDYAIESATFFDGAFNSFENIDARYITLGAAGRNPFFAIIGLVIINLALLYVLVFKVKKTGDYLSMPYKSINFICAIGILFHMLIFILSTPSCRNEEFYFKIIFRGMLLPLIIFVSYIVIIEFFHIIKKKKLSYNDSFKTKLNCFDVVIIAFLIEILLSYFYVTLDQRLIGHFVNKYGEEYTRKFGHFYMSQFVMVIKQNNYFGLEGKIESYPYMLIILFLIIGQIVVAFLKPKFRITIITCLSVINILIMTIGLLDMRDSFYARYINDFSRSFFDLVGPGYYFIIALNIAVLGVNLYSYNYEEPIIISVREIEAFVNADAIKKEEEAKEKEDIYVIKEDIIEEEKVEDEGDDFNENEA